MANPTLLISPIAENGDKNVIPSTTGATTGLLDQEHGFQQINELPLQAGGLPPQRKDFNGAFNLLSKILFYAQKGYVFDFDENQDYYAGCITKDTDGGLYCANNDVSASSTHPKDDPTNWTCINYGLNKKETFTTSGSFTAPVTGTYRITLQGGGGGGSGAGTQANVGNRSGSGGGQGGNLVAYEKLIAGTSYPFTIGAGGTGGTAGSTTAGTGGSATAGGDTSITVNGNAYVAGGGGGAAGYANAFTVGAGGKSTINGTEAIGRGQAGTPSRVGNIANYGGTGGGFGGGGYINIDGAFGGGGKGGDISGSYVYSAGGNGGDGYISFEYCDI